MKLEGMVEARLGFALRFILVFGLLLAPWPGWNAGYAQYFRAFAGLCFSSSGGARVVSFSPNPDPQSPLDTRVSLGNREFLDHDGRGIFKRTEIDTRSLGWVPTALTAALVLSTPISWWRRWSALVGALVLIHLFIAFSLQTWIWDNSPDLSLATFSQGMGLITNELDYALMNQLGVSFAVPVGIWILVTFRSQDVSLGN